MKRYIKANTTVNPVLVSAIDQLLCSTLDMGDSLEDLVENLAYIGDIELPEEYDAATMLKSVLGQLVEQKSEDLSHIILDSILEYSDMLLDEISTSNPSGKQSDLYKAISIIHDQIGGFPSGTQVQNAIETTIFSNPLIDGNAAEVGYQIGQIYWKYISSKEYGIRSNTASAVGVSAGCRDAIGGKYKYAFVQSISNYYYKDLYKDNPNMPFDTGYIVKFYNEGDMVLADIFNLYSVGSKSLHWEFGTRPVHTIVIDSTSESELDVAAQEIAEWLDNHVQDAIDSAIKYATTRW